MLFAALATSFFVVAAWRILQRITWYVAAWQLGYLTFGRDLAHGAVAHQSPFLDALRDLLPSRTDVMAQSYLWDHGTVYCRFAPGFPLVLAAVMRAFSDDAVHYVNAVLFVTLLALLFALGRRLFGSPWLAMAVPTLVALLPTKTSWWALTPMPDMAAHTTGLVALYVLSRPEVPISSRRLAASGVALGWAIGTRPDAALYLLPAASIAAFRIHDESRPRRHLMPGIAAAILGLVIGMTPFLAYNWHATGNPLLPTQAMDAEGFFTGASSSPGQASKGGVWHGTTAIPAAGGGLRLANLPYTLPKHVEILRANYGDLLLAAAAWGALVALLARPLVFLTTVPYIIVATLFFSCWTRPDPRFLMGVDFLLPFLVLQGTIGTIEVVRGIADRGHLAPARALAVAGVCLVAIGALLLSTPARTPFMQGLVPGSPLVLAGIIEATTVLALVLATTRDAARARDLAGAVLLVGLVVLVFHANVPSLGTRAPFQHDQVERGRTTIAGAVEPTGVVITTEDVGRPADNIEYYTGIPAVYLADLERWRLTVPDVAARLLRAGMQPYLLLPDERATTAIVDALSPRFTVQRSAQISPQRAIDYFIAAPVRRTSDLGLYRITPRE